MIIYEIPNGRFVPKINHIVIIRIRPGETKFRARAGRRFNIADIKLEGAGHYDAILNI